MHSYATCHLGVVLTRRRRDRRKYGQRRQTPSSSLCSENDIHNTTGVECQANPLYDGMQLLGQTVTVYVHIIILQQVSKPITAKFDYYRPPSNLGAAAV